MSSNYFTGTRWEKLVRFLGKQWRSNSLKTDGGILSLWFERFSCGENISIKKSLKSIQQVNKLNKCSQVEKISLTSSKPLALISHTAITLSTLTWVDLNSLGFKRRNSYKQASYIPNMLRIFKSICFRKRIWESAESTSTDFRS